MIDLSDRRQARDAAIVALLPFVELHGWTMAALRRGAGNDVDHFFPGGPGDLVEAYFDLADREMVDHAPPGLVGWKLSKRVRTLILVRFEEAKRHRPAVRKAAAFLARPSNAAMALRRTAQTVDAIWAAAGDSSADFDWYTKRASLAAIYTATFLYWLGRNPTADELAAFLDRRLAGLSSLGRLRARLNSCT